jgi:hypothetical protein
MDPSACVQVTFILLNNGPKQQDSDGGYSDTPERMESYLL